MAMSASAERDRQDIAALTPAPMSARTMLLRRNDSRDRSGDSHRSYKKASAMAAMADSANVPPSHAIRPNDSAPRRPCVARADMRNAAMAGTERSTLIGTLRNQRSPHQNATTAAQAAVTATTRTARTNPLDRVVRWK